MGRTAPKTWARCEKRKGSFPATSNSHFGDLRGKISHARVIFTRLKQQFPRWVSIQVVIQVVML
jgi:hypothetical protein